jgi:hypothetical protein
MAPDTAFATAGYRPGQLFRSLNRTRCRQKTGGIE